MTKNTQKYAWSDSTFFKHGQLTVVRCKDKLDVFAVSTFHDNPCNKNLPYKPDLIETYNQNRNAADCVDQLLAYYSLNKKLVNGS